jgi:hypothetical protein
MVATFNNIIASNEFSANNLRRNKSVKSNESKRNLTSAVTTSRNNFFKIEGRNSSIKVDSTIKEYADPLPTFKEVSSRIVSSKKKANLYALKPNSSLI